jgi:hypothetical protein
VLVGQRQLDAGEEKEAPLLGVFLELAVEGDNVVVGYGQDIETPLCGPVDELL